MNGEAGLALAGLASRSDAARLGSVTVRSSRTSLSVVQSRRSVSKTYNALTADVRAVIEPHVHTA